MICLSDEILSASLDGEAEPREEEAVCVHLAACALCRGRLEAMRALDAAMRDLPLAKEPRSPALAGTVRAFRAFQDAPKWRWREGALRTAAKAATGLAAAAILAAMLVMEPSTGTPARALADDAVTNHLRAMSSGDGSGCQVASEDPDAVSAWIAEVVGRAVDVPRLAGATLVGARRCSLMGEETAALVYRSGETAFSLYLPPKGSAAAAACDRAESRCVEKGGQTVCVIPDPEGAPMVMVGALPGQELCSVAASG